MAIVGGVTVQKGASLAAFPPNCTLTQVKNHTRDLGGGTTEITVRDVKAARPNWPVSFTERSFKYAPASAPCDMILTYEGKDGAFNAIVPAGGKVNDNGSEVQTIYGTAFGNP